MSLYFHADVTIFQHFLISHRSAWSYAIVDTFCLAECIVDGQIRTPVVPLEVWGAGISQSTFQYHMPAFGLILFSFAVHSRPATWSNSQICLFVNRCALVLLRIVKLMCFFVTMRWIDYGRDFVLRNATALVHGSRSVSFSSCLRMLKVLMQTVPTHGAKLSSRLLLLVSLIL